MGWRLPVALGALLLAAPAAAGDERLDPGPAVQARLVLEERAIPTRPGVRLLRERLRISGIEPDDVARTLEAYNRRSEILQFTPEGVALAPHILDRALSLDPGQLLQFRFSGQAAKLVFRMTWR
ncbi:MAG TPA: hypothetical protein VFM53_04045 [Anaeromyxobacteraceae bacterium]|nr:hypothetical protein [Anaeromyxobacteraceae bacterium]